MIDKIFDDNLDSQIWENKIYPLSEKAVSLGMQIDDYQNELKKYYCQDENGNDVLLPYIENNPKKPDYIIGSIAAIAFGGAGILSALNKVLDKAIEDEDTTLIFAAMSNISGIVTKSLLDKLERLYERFDDPNDSGLDF